MKPLARAGIAKLLELPRAYSWFADLVAGDARMAYMRDYIRPVSGQRIIDIGCGPAAIVSDLPAGVEYVGFDSNPKYIEAARARFGARATFHCETVSSAIASRYTRFDIAMANGVLHHLDDAQALELLRLARDALSEGGRLITLDGCYLRTQSPMAKLLLWLDRGRYVRSAEGYLQLAQHVFRTVVPHVRHDLLRIPYTHLVLECRR